MGASRGAPVCAATEAGAGGNPRGVEDAAPYVRVSYCPLPAAYCLNSAFCVLHFAFRPWVRPVAHTVRRYGTLILDL